MKEEVVSLLRVEFRKMLPLVLLMANGKSVNVWRKLYWISPVLFVVDCHLS